MKKQEDKPYVLKEKDNMELVFDRKRIIQYRNVCRAEGRKEIIDKIKNIIRNNGRSNLIDVEELNYIIEEEEEKKHG